MPPGSAHGLLRHRAPPRPPGPASAHPAPPQPVSPGPWGPSAGRAGRLAPPGFCKFVAPVERAARPGPLPTFFPSSPRSPPLVLPPSARRRLPLGAPSLSLLFPPPPPSLQFYSIVYYLLLGGEPGAKGEERGVLEPRDSRWRPVSARRALDEEAAQRMATRRRAPGSRACGDNDIICLYASN